MVHGPLHNVQETPSTHGKTHVHLQVEGSVFRNLQIIPCFCLLGSLYRDDALLPENVCRCFEGGTFFSSRQFERGLYCRRNGSCTLSTVLVFARIGCCSGTVVFVSECDGVHSVGDCRPHPVRIPLIVVDVHCALFEEEGQALVHLA